MRKGSHHTVEAKEKIRIGNVGNTNALGCRRTDECKRKLRKAMMRNTNGLGHCHTDEAKQKIREARIGEKNPMYGKHHTEKTKRKMSKSMVGDRNPRYGKHDTEAMKTKRREPMIGNTHALGYRWTKAAKRKKSEAMIGENNPNYIDGRGNEPYPLEFNDELKEFIRQRDGYVCQKCRTPQNGRRLDVHHIDYNMRNCLTSNLISLCTCCNTKVNFNRKFWEEYLGIWLKNEQTFARDPCAEG